MKRIILFAAALLALSPAEAGQKKPLVLSATGQAQPVQATDTLLVSQSTTSAASINLPHGTAPTSPNNGDLWTTSNGVYARVNGATLGPVAGLGTAQTWTAKQAHEFALSGSLASNFSYLFNPQALGIWSTSDNQASGTTGTNIPSLVSIEQYFGGTNVDDGRNALGVALHMTAATKSTNPYRYYAAGNFVADTAFNDGGTSGSESGYLYGVGGVVRLKSGATNYRGAIPADFEVAVETGASARFVVATFESTWPTHAVHGSLIDAARWTTASGVGWTDGWRISNDGGAANPIIATGTIIRATGSWTVSQGIDLSDIHVANFALNSDGVIKSTSTAASTSTTTGAVRIPNGGLGVGGSVYAGGVVATGSYTIAALPTCNAGNLGARAMVSNGQTSPTFLGTVSTTGAVVAPVVCNGTGWVYG